MNATRHSFFAALSVILLTGSLSAHDQRQALDSSTVFYLGQTQNYIVYAPGGFRMVVDSAVHDGYSFAYVPDNERYDSCSLMITGVFYRLDPQSRKEKSFAAVLSADTADVRSHYGKSLTFAPLDTVRIATGEALRAFYLDDKTRFIPNVMVAYLDGGTEALIFELTIADLYPRFKAEEVYFRFLSNIKVLKKGKLKR
jgi:hypothetical protein